MAKRVRIRHAGGAATIEVPVSATVGEVAHLIESVAKELPPSSQVWKAGYPPARLPPLGASESFPSNVDMLHVSPVGPDAEPTVKFGGFEDDGEGEAPVEDLAPADHPSAAAMAAAYFKADEKDPPVTDPEGVIVRRVVDADNSCLFNSIGYVLRRSRNDAPLLRRMIARAVGDDPETFTAAFLEKEPKDYVSFISSAGAWGGQIELHIFSRLFRIEIAAFDIIRNREDVYGAGEGYKRRALVIYDGIHYDALAFAFDSSLPEDMDVTLFSPRDEVAMARGRAVCAEQHRRKAFTDTSNFTLRCAVCQAGLKGAAEAQEHAKETGHTDFAEFR